jgi:hypothetical protein
MDGFIEHAQNTLPGFAAQSGRASDKALTFIRRWAVVMLNSPDTCHILAW